MGFSLHFIHNEWVCCGRFDCFSHWEFASSVTSRQNFSIRALFTLGNTIWGGGGGAGESQTFNLGEITKGKRKRALDGRMPLGLLCRYYVGEGCWAAVRGNYSPKDGWTGGRVRGQQLIHKVFSAQLKEKRSTSKQWRGKHKAAANGGGFTNLS